MKTHPHTHLVAATAYAVDKSVRADLCHKNVVSEPDYVSNLTAGIRKLWACHGLPNFAHSQTLERSQENKFGCDAMILLRRGNTAKVCLFEAKWPRLTLPQTQWDSIQTSSRISHFTDQLRRQSNWVGRAAIWESFIHEWPPGQREKGFDEWGCTCFWHQDAHSFDQKHRKPANVWSDADLRSLAAFVRRRRRNIMGMLLRAARCQEGIYLPIEGGRVHLQSSNEEEFIKVPASPAAFGDEIGAFVEEHNLRHFLFLSLTGE